MIRADELSSDTEKPDEFLSEQALQRFDEYVLRFEELWEKYEGGPDRDQKIADELGCTLVHDEGDDAEVIDGRLRTEDLCGGISRAALAERPFDRSSQRPLRRGK
jgi:hypothetical protein